MSRRQLQALRSFRWHRHTGMAPLAARARVLAMFGDRDLADMAYLLGV